MERSIVVTKIINRPLVYYFVEFYHPEMGLALPFRKEIRIQSTPRPEPELVEIAKKELEQPDYKFLSIEVDDQYLEF